MSLIEEPIFNEDNGPEIFVKASDTNLVKRIHHLLNSQLFCVLCTQGQSQPYGSLIAFAFRDDLKTFFFTTATSTRKYKLLKECGLIALLIDSRCQHQSNMTEVEAVTITCKAEQVLPGSVYDEGIEKLRGRHAYLSAFLDAPSTVLFRAEVVRYFHVTRFQEVLQWIP
jgi:hypothetical protein